MKTRVVSVAIVILSAACSGAPSPTGGPSATTSTGLDDVALLSKAHTLTSGDWYPQYVAVDATNVYWTNCPKVGCYQPGASVMQCPIAGCPSGPTQIWTAGPAIGGQYQNPGAIAVDATSVYFTYTQNTVLGVVSVPIGGGAATTLVSATAEDSGYSPLAVDSKSVFFRDDIQGIGKCSITGCGGAATYLDSATNGATALALNPHDTSIYYLSKAGSAQVDSISVKGTGEAALVTGIGSTSRTITVANGSAFWVSGDSVESCAVAGCSNTATTLATGCTPWQIVPVNEDLYVSNLCGTGSSGNLSYVFKVPQAGGTATKIVRDQEEMSGIAVDSTTLYWGTYAGGSATNPGEIRTAKK